MGWDTGENGKSGRDDVLAAGLKAAAALLRLGQWRTVFASWQLGTRPESDPEAGAVANLWEYVLVLRAELNALSGLLIDHGIVTEEQMAMHLAKAADDQSAAYSRTFPGITAIEDGLVIEPFTVAAWQKARGWKP